MEESNKENQSRTHKPEIKCKTSPNFRHRHCSASGASGPAGRGSSQTSVPGRSPSVLQHEGFTTTHPGYSRHHSTVAGPKCTAGALLSIQFRYSFPYTLFQATLGCGYRSQMLQPLVSNANQLTIYVFFPEKSILRTTCPTLSFIICT